METAETTPRCDKTLPDGSACGKPFGACIHKWVPTPFGALPEPGNGVVDPDPAH